MYKGADICAQVYVCIRERTYVRKYMYVHGSFQNRANPQNYGTFEYRIAIREKFVTAMV